MCFPHWKRGCFCMALIPACIRDNAALVCLVCVVLVATICLLIIVPGWLKAAKDPASALQNLVTVVAIVIGGMWAFQRFVITRETAWNVQVTVTPTVLPYDANCHLMVVKVSLKNVGKVIFRAGRKGIELKVDELLKKAAVGEPFLSKLNRKAITAKPIPMLDDDAKLYEIEPGGEYHEVEAMLVPKDVFLAVSVTVFGDDELPVDEEVIVRSVDKSG